MSQLIIEGSRRLSGEVKIQGAKNSVLPILAASIMCKDECVIKNCPDISDVRVTNKILNYLGCSTSFENGTFIIDSKNISKNDIPDFLMREMRSSVILAGGIIGKYNRAVFSYPGDCDIWWIYRTSIR